MIRSNLTNKLEKVIEEEEKKLEVYEEGRMKRDRQKSNNSYASLIIKKISKLNYVDADLLARISVVIRPF